MNSNSYAMAYPRPVYTGTVKVAFGLTACPSIVVNNA